MKLKLRIALILSLCAFMMIVLAFYFRFSQLEHQKLDNFPFSHSYQHLKQITTPSKTSSSDEYYKNLTINSVATVVGIKVNRKLQALNFTSSEKSSKYLNILNTVKNNVDLSIKMKVSPWNLAASWVKPYEIHSENTPELGYVLHSMAVNDILYAGLWYKGSQLKIMLKLIGGQEVIFKPMRFERDYVVTGLPYDGSDRHNGEIAAFHLNRLLGLCRAPLTVGRTVNLKTEIQPVASARLLNTYITKDNNTCFYGHCQFCYPEDPACGRGDIIEGAAILMLPEKYRLKKYRSPWQRTYKETVTARWEQDFSYCDRIKKVSLYKKGRLLLDLIDAAVFDYLIGNADRHHYEVFADFPESMVLLLDNGKSFGNPYWDELTILAPLYQCCKIRKSLFDRLWTFVGHLGHSLKEILNVDFLAPVLAPSHFEALDRRLKTILATIEVCFDEFGEEKVLVNN